MKIWTYLAKYLFATSILMASSHAIATLTEAYACSRCDLEAAKKIAIQEAPENKCNTHNHASASAVCEPISKEIIVLSHSDKRAYKFIVTTEFDFNNQPKVSSGRESLTPSEELAAKDYFTFQKDFASTIVNLNESNLQEYKEQTFQYKGAVDETENSSCNDHPINFFRGNAQKRQIKMELAAELNEFAVGKNWQQVQIDASGDGITLNKANNGVAVVLEYLEENFVISKFYDASNYLAFDVYMKTPIITDGPTQIIADFSLNQGQSRIDGFTVNELFQPDNGELKLGSTKMSRCWDDFISDKAEDITHYRGANSDSGTLFKDRPDNALCFFKAKINICSNNTEGNQQCWKPTISRIDNCNAV